MPAEAMPDFASGNSIFQNACHGVQPSICAASFRSLGTWRKKPSVSQMVKGTLIATNTRITPGFVSIIPKRDQIMKTGSERAMPGTVRESINQRKIGPLAGKR